VYPKTSGDQNDKDTRLNYRGLRCGDGSNNKRRSCEFGYVHDRHYCSQSPQTTGPNQRLMNQNKTRNQLERDIGRERISKLQSVLPDI